MEICEKEIGSGCGSRSRSLAGGLPSLAGGLLECIFLDTPLFFINYGKGVRSATPG